MPLRDRGRFEPLFFQSGAIDDDFNNNKHLAEYESQLRKDISKGLFDIKDSLKTRRKLFRKDLTERTKAIRSEEKKLSNLTKFYSKWKKIQNNTMFFHIFRGIVEKTYKLLENTDCLRSNDLSFHSKFLSFLQRYL